MMTYLFSLLTIVGSSLLLLSTTAVAQTQDYASDDVIERKRAEEPINEGNYPKTVETLNEQADGVQGDPYFTDDWIEGQVKLDGGDEYENVQLRYDVFHNQLLIRNKEGEATPIDPEEVRSFTLGPPRLANLAWFQRAKYLEGLVSTRCPMSSSCR